MPQTTDATDTRRAARRSRQWWFEQVQAWQSSGLGKAEYCAAHGLKAASLYLWASRFRQQGDQARNAATTPASHSAFVRALVQPDGIIPAACALTIRDVTVQFDAGLTPEGLVEWVRVLRALPC